MSDPSQPSGGSVPKSVLESLGLQLQAENTQLRQANDELRAANAALVEQVTMLTQIVQELQARLNKDSHNSGKPPSSDGLKKPNPKSQRGKSGKSSGGQPGHRGTTLRMQDQPDHHVEHTTAICSCGTSLTDVAADAFERRQVFDLPPLDLEVTEHRCSRKICPKCGQVHQGQFPASVSHPVQYGERIKAAAVYLTAYQLLPWERTTQMLGDLFGASLSQSTLQAAQQECKTSIAPIAQQIKEAITRSDIAHFDETGQRIAGELHWGHVACTPNLTYYEVHRKRGREAINAIGILPLFGGRAIHDAMTAYQSYSCRHGLCNAHHLRELDFIREQYDQVWAARFKKWVLLDAKREVDRAKAMGLTAMPPERIRHFEKEFDRLIQQGYATNPKSETAAGRGRAKQTPGYNLVRRLQRRDQVLAFLYDFTAPFDNNQAERDLRMMKVKQKVSGCFRTLEGARTFNTIRSYLSTLHKQGQNMLRALETVFQGAPIQPVYA